MANAPVDKTPSESRTTSFTDTTLEDKKPKMHTDRTSSPKLEAQNEPKAVATAAASPLKDEIITTMTAKEAQAKKDAEEDMKYPHGLKLILILAALCLAVFLVALDQTIIATAIPKIVLARFLTPCSNSR
jgi:hypothetical protein